MHPAGKVKLGEDAVGSLDRPVDVLVRRPDRVRPHLQISTAPNRIRTTAFQTPQDG